MITSFEPGRFFKQGGTPQCVGGTVGGGGCSPQQVGGKPVSDNRAKWEIKREGMPEEGSYFPPLPVHPGSLEDDCIGGHTHHNLQRNGKLAPTWERLQNLL